MEQPLARHRTVLQDHARPLAASTSLELAFLLGLLAGVLFVSGFYWLGIRGRESVGGGLTASGWRASSRTRSCRSRRRTWLAHYFTLLLYQGQAISYLASDPFGEGSDLFGTAELGDRLRADRPERRLVP